MAFAEGASIVLDCHVVTRCSGDGECQSANDPISLRFDPLGPVATGGQRYVITYDDVAVEAFSADGVSFTFSEGSDDMQTLLAGNGTGVIWHRLDQSGPPRASVDFLDCEAPR